MQKLVKFAGILLGFTLMSCFNSPSTKSAPVIQSANGQIFSVFDTVTVQFDQGLSSFAPNNFDTSVHLNYLWDSSKPDQVKFFGQGKYIGMSKWPMMNSGASLIVNFKDVKSASGMVVDSALSFSFTTAILADSDFMASGSGVNNNRTNNKMSTADSLMSKGLFLGGSSRNSHYGSQIYSGLLAGNANEYSGGDDRDDFYRVQFELGDSVNLQLRSNSLSSGGKCQGLVLLELRGPLSAVDTNVPVEYDTAHVQKDCSLQLATSISASRQVAGMSKTDSISAYAPLNYWIHVTYVNGNALTPIPYTFQLQLISP